MLGTCAKCGSVIEDRLEIFVEGGIAHEFCHLCGSILDKFNTGNRVHAFLEDQLDLHAIARSMIEAKKRRASGQLIWD